MVTKRRRRFINRDAFVCLVLYELVIILTALPISVNLQFCLKLSVNFVDLSFLSRISFCFFTLFLKYNLCFGIILCYFTIRVCNTLFVFFVPDIFFQCRKRYRFSRTHHQKIIPERSCLYRVHFSKLFQQTKRLFLNSF